MAIMSTTTPAPSFPERNSMSSLHILPVELIDGIFSLLAKPDLLSLRLINKRLSGLATVFVFSSIITLSTEESLGNLQKISSSEDLACHVRSFEYRFLGIYDIPCLAMSFAQFKARLSSPGRSYYGHLLGEFHSHYMQQYEAQERIASSRKDHQILSDAFKQFWNLKSVSLRNAEPEQQPYWQESWTYVLKNAHLGGEIAHQNITDAIKARHELSSELVQPFTDVTFFSATELPPIFSRVSFGQTGRFEFDPLDTSLRSGLTNITTLNLDLRPPRRSKYQAHQNDQPRQKYWSTEQLARALASLKRLENLRLYVEESSGRGARFLENPLQGSWESLRVAIVSGWEFGEEDVIGFAKRHAQTLRSFFVGCWSLIVYKDEQADEVFFRIWDKLRDMTFECLLEGPFYWGVRGEGSENSVVQRNRIPIDLNGHPAEHLRRSRRRLEDLLFTSPTYV